MKRNVGLLLVALSAAAIAASWSGSFRFSPNSVQLADAARDGQDFQLVQPVRGSGPEGLGALVLSQPGKPLLPQWSLTLVIPQGMQVAGVDCEARDAKVLGQGLRVFPGQPPVPFSQTRLPQFVPPYRTVYESDAAWPGSYASASPVGIKSGFRLVTITLHPLQYRPASGQLTIAGELAVTVRYEPDPQAQPEFLTAGQLATFGAAVQTLVYNPGDVSRYAPKERRTDFGSIDCVVITSDALEADFQPLVNWRTRKGFKTETRTVAWITANYSGRDTPEKIRNFVIDYYNTQGLRWVLLGGDNAVVPCRQARAYVNGEPGDIPADLYYGDIQGTWDDDNDNIFGEDVDDNVDLYYDLYVGRASVDNTTQVQTFVNKVLTHEKTPPTDYLRRMLMADALLWSGYDHTQSNDSIEAITPSGWTDVIIHSPGASTAVRDSINNGFQFCHFVGHGNEYGIYDGDDPYYNTDFANSQTNGSKVNLMNANSCHTGNFEYSDCVAEAAHNCSGGGSIAVIFNSRYGWGWPPYIGPSELLDVRFYDYFFNHDTMPIGITLALSKEVYRADALADQCWRWCYYEYNLFGDPLLLMYQDVPGQLDASYTSPISTGSQTFTVTVTASASPVANALVCLSKGSEVYARDYTSASGQVAISINPTTIGYMYVTATRANYLPDEDTCQVILGSGDVGVQRIVAPADTVDSGTVVTPQAWVRNYGTVVATFPVTMDIGLDYTDIQTVTDLAANDSLLVSFADWTAIPRNAQAVRCSTGLAGDDDTGNDTLSGSVMVRVQDVGIVGINCPVGVYSPGVVVTPAATVRNHGNVPADFEACLFIDDPTGALHYSASTNVFDAAPGTNLLVDAFPACTLDHIGDWAIRCSTAMLGDMQLDNNVKTGGFRTKLTWTQMKQMPTALTGKQAKDGAWLAYHAASGLIYGAKGNRSGDFYSYDPATGEWSSLASILYGVEGKLPRKGACGVTDGSQFIYLAKGNNTNGFWRYDIAGDAWHQLRNVPMVSLSKVKPGAGIAFVQAGDTGYVYLLKGNRCEFYRYSNVTDTWEILPSAPVGAYPKWLGGSFLVYDGDHTIYAHKARYHELWAYNTQAGSWGATRLSGIPYLSRSGRTRRSKDGGCGAWLDGGIYALKGGNTCEFWRYNVNADMWVEYDTIPALGSSERMRRVGPGGSMVNAGGALYALKGNRTNELWRYGTGSLAAPQPAHEGVTAERLSVGEGQPAIGPNPLTGGIMHLAVGRTPLSGSATVRMYNVAGLCIGVWKPLVWSGTARMDVRHLAAGVYLVTVEVDGLVTSQKLVVQR